MLTRKNVKSVMGNSISFNFLRLIDEDRREFEFVNKKPEFVKEENLDVRNIRLERIYNLLAVFYFILKEKKHPLPRKEWVKMQIAKYPKFAMRSQGFRKEIATYSQLIRSFFSAKRTGLGPVEMILKYKTTAKVLSDNNDLMKKKVVVNFTNNKRLIKNRMTPTEVKKIHAITGLTSPNRDTMSYLLWCVQKIK